MKSFIEIRVVQYTCDTKAFPPKDVLWTKLHKNRNRIFKLPITLWTCMWLARVLVPIILQFYGI